MAPTIVEDKKDYYSILGVNKGTDENEIKKSYYRLAKKWHPDKNKSVDAEDKFKEINKAYEVLSDSSKRRLYDLQNNFYSSTTVTTTTTATSNNNNANNPSSQTNGTSRTTSYTFYQTTTDNNKSNYDWTKYSNKTSDKEPKEDTPKPQTRPTYNSTPDFKNFYEEYKKYFDSSFFKDVNDNENSSETDDDLNSPKFKNENKSSSFRAKNTTTRPKWNKNWATEDNFRQRNSKSSNGIHEDSYFFNDDRPNSSINSRSSFKNNSTDPCELLEYFAMYKLFSEMSDRLFKNVNDDETLLNLAKIISSLNLPKNSTNNNNNQNRPADTSNINDNNNKSNKSSPRFSTADTNSDFLFDDNLYSPKTPGTTANNSFSSTSNKLPKVSVPKSTSSRTSQREKSPSWEFEWLGKNTRKQEAPIPPFVRIDSDDDDDLDDYCYNYKPYESKNTNYTKKSFDMDGNNTNENEANGDDDDDDDEDYEYDEIYNLNEKYKLNDLFGENRLYKCHYCDRQLSDKQALLKHQPICKRITQNKPRSKYFDINDKKTTTNASSDYCSSSPNTTFSSGTSPSSSILITECPKCKISMNTYDYLLHQCTTKKTTTSQKSSEIPLNGKLSSDNLSKSTNFASQVKSNLNEYKRFSPSFRVNPTVNNNNLNSKLNNRRSYDATNTTNGSKMFNGIGATLSSANLTSNIINSNRNIPSHQSDFVYTKVKSPLLTSNKNQPQSSTMSPRRTSKILLNDIENRDIPKKSSTSINENLINGNILNDSIYTSSPSVTAAKLRHNQSQEHLKRTTPLSSNSLAYAKSMSYTKPYLSSNTPSYSKTSRLSSAGLSSLLNSSYTGLKREKLRTGF